jgi:hypothetical protein
VPLVADGKPKPAETINTDLAEIRAYSRLDEDNIATWIALRNDAIHGHYDRYTTHQALAMMSGVSVLLRWTLPLGAVDKSVYGTDPSALDTTSPTGWFGDVG